MITCSPIMVLKVLCIIASSAGVAGQPNFSDCGTLVGCLRLPVDCTGINCHAAVFWHKPKPTDKFIHMDMYGKIPADIPSMYVALGWSKTKNMHDTSVTHCMTNGDQIKVGASYNKPPPDYSNRIIAVSDQQIDTIFPAENQTKSVENGYMKCSFIRRISAMPADIPDDIWPIEDQKYHILLAYGRADYAASPMGRCSMHTAKWMSPMMVDVTTSIRMVDTGSVGDTDDDSEDDGNTSDVEEEEVETTVQFQYISSTTMSPLAATTPKGAAIALPLMVMFLFPGLVILMWFEN